MSKNIAIEDIYKKKNLHQHIIDLPDTYIGSVSVEKKEMWVYNSESNLIELKEITFVPGLYKIYDEILVNARDHTVRDKTCKTIKVNIDKENNTISVWNDGKGVPIVKHKEYNIYIPELIFANLLSSTNYDTKGKTVGGKNGFGAKLANIFSTEFEIETVDSETKKKYYQKCENNMYKINEPIIEDSKEKSYTKITFKADLERFSLKELTSDIVSLFQKRVYDIAGCCDSVKVYLNDEQIKMKSFEDYIKLYFKKEKIIYEEHKRWKIGAIYCNNEFLQVSFVNGILTFQGGNHVSYILDQICSKLITIIKQKNKTVNVKPSHIRDNLVLFIDSVIEDPSFNSQTKELLNNKKDTFGSTCEISDEFIKELSKTGIVEQVIKFAEFKDMSSLKKTDGKKVSKLRDIEKLEDAQWAGSRKSKHCRLILTEGDSAKSFAMSGLKIIGREKYGVFPLKGKPLNVREATVKQLQENEEFINIKKILGLKQGIKYDDVSKLRYGGIVLLSDQDPDGSHIKGLLMNMFHTMWPSLLKIKGFIQCMTTPLIKIFKKSDIKRQNPIDFYNFYEFENWKNNNETSKYIIKYYKGLGTSTEKEARDAFNDFDKKIINYIWDIQNENNKVDINNNDENENKKETQKESEKEIYDSEDSDDEKSVKSNKSENSKRSNKNEEEDDIDLNDMNSTSYKALTLAFEKKKADDRKEWIMNYDKNNVLLTNSGDILISDFINKELIHFSKYDCDRSIPSMCDGLKPSQRKILYSSFKKKIFNDEIKVAQLGAYVSEQTHYLHGENSLFGAIINMAQDFTGTNNINLLNPNGNFGNRRGGEPSAPRYIFTQLNKLTPLIFRKEDDPILNHLYEDNDQIEPEYYAPIIPMVLINGVEGIGTGFSTFIPPFNPKEVINNIINLIDSKKLNEIQPWFKGFKGKITKVNKNKYNTQGIYQVIDSNTVLITEIPIGITIDKYKKNIETKYLIDENDKKNKQGENGRFIVDLINNSDNNEVNISLIFKGNYLQKLIKNGNLEDYLKLKSSISISNMYLHNSEGKIAKFDEILDIIMDYYTFRLEFYTKRKNYMLKHLENQLNILKYKVLFIKYVLADTIIIKKRKESDIIDDLIKLEFPKMSHDAFADESKKSYNYLTDMPLFSLTEDKINKLNDEYENKKKEYDDYLNTPETEIWRRELMELDKEYDKFINDFNNVDESKSKKNKKIKNDTLDNTSTNKKVNKK